MFRGHHYLNGGLNKSCKVFLCYWDDVLVGFFATLSAISGMYKYAYRGHRYVVLPDYQGMGIGTAMANFIAKYYVSHGYKYFVRASHIRIKENMKNSGEWLETSANEQKRSQRRIDYIVERIKVNKSKSGIVGDNRICGSFEYVGKDYFIKPHKEIRVDYYDGLDVEQFEDYIRKLLDDYYVIVVTGLPKETNPIEEAMLNIGVRTEQLYYNKNGKLILKTKYVDTETYNEEI